MGKAEDELAHFRQIVRALRYAGGFDRQQWDFRILEWITINAEEYRGLYADTIQQQAGETVQGEGDDALAFHPDCGE